MKDVVLIVGSIKKHKYASRIRKLKADFPSIEIRMIRNELDCYLSDYLETYEDLTKLEDYSGEFLDDNWYSHVENRVITCDELDYFYEAATNAWLKDNDLADCKIRMVIAPLNTGNYFNDNESVLAHLHVKYILL